MENGVAVGLKIANRLFFERIDPSIHASRQDYNQRPTSP